MSLDDGILLLSTEFNIDDYLFRELSREERLEILKLLADYIGEATSPSAIRAFLRTKGIEIG